MSKHDKRRARRRQDIADCSRCSHRNTTHPGSVRCVTVESGKVRSPSPGSREPFLPLRHPRRTYSRLVTPRTGFIRFSEIIKKLNEHLIFQLKAKTPVFCPKNVKTLTTRTPWFSRIMTRRHHIRLFSLSNFGFRHIFGDFCLHGIQDSKILKNGFSSYMYLATIQVEVSRSK